MIILQLQIVLSLICRQDCAVDTAAMDCKPYAAHTYLAVLALYSRLTRPLVIKVILLLVQAVFPSSCACYHHCTPLLIGVICVGRCYWYLDKDLGRKRHGLAHKLEDD